ncbi:unnamed protein product [Urochloa humidicola]
MAFVLRYVNARGEVIERFLGLKEVADTSSLSLKMALDDQNIVRAVGLIEATLRTINDIRDNGWEELFEELKESSQL